MRPKFILPEKFVRSITACGVRSMFISSQKSRQLSHFLLFCMLFSSFHSAAQQANLLCNKDTALITTRFTDLIVTNSPANVVGVPLSRVTNAGNLTTPLTTDFALVELTGLAETATIRVTDNTAGEEYTGGNYVGFRLARTGGVSLSLLNVITIRTYLNGNLVDTANGASLLAIPLVGSTFEVGFKTTGNYDAVELQLGSLIALLDEYNVYNAFSRRYCAGPALSCNMPNPVTLPKYPAVIDLARSQYTGVNVGGITNADYAIDNDPATAATVSLTGSGTARFAIKNDITNYTDIGAYVGFDISNSLANATLLSRLTVNTYLDGVLQDTRSANDLTSAPVSLLNGSGRRRIGLITTKGFDEVQLEIASTVSVGDVNVYSAFFQPFCTVATPVCNVPTILGAPNYPVIIDNALTGIGGVDALSSISNTDNIIDTSSSTFGTIALAGALNSGSVAVQNRLVDYPAKTFAGFDMEATGLLSANAAGAITISVYRDGVFKQSKTGTNALIAASTGLLTNSNRQTIGFAADSSFDEVRITAANTANVTLGTIRIYSAVIKTLCAKTITCNTTYSLVNKDFPVIINSQRTGFDGLACALCSIEGADNVIDSVTGNFGLIHIVAGAVGRGDIAVKDPTSIYPAGTFAGFSIQDMTGILKANILNSISIRTYRRDTLVESRGSGNVIDLTALITLFGNGTNQYNVGFITTQPFDEIVISVGSVVGAVNNVRVYGAIIDTRTAASGSLLCRVLNPDFNVTQINVSVEGNVSSNDVTAANTTYGTTPVAAPGNPVGGLLVMQATGAYTFTSPNVGMYTYYVPVCQESQTVDCAVRELVITVTNDAINTNPPIANADIATTKGTTPVTVKTLANDQCPNPGCSLNPQTVTVPSANTPGGPSNGSVSVNTTTGDITYTPAAGFTGIDSITYTVCDYQTPAKCASAKQYFTVLPAGAANSTVAADDYTSTWLNITRTGNVKTNDSDPEGNTQTVTPQTTTVAGKGTLTLLADGSYRFVPVNNFRGEVDYMYTTCDNGTPQACASATLHMLVNGAPAVPELTPEIVTDTMALNSGGSAVLIPIKFRNNGTIPTSSRIVISIAKINDQFTLSIDPNANGTIGAEAYDNRDWDIVEQTNRFILTSKAGFSIAAGGAKNIALSIVANGISTSTANLSVEIVQILLSNGTSEVPADSNRGSIKFIVN